MDIGGFLLTAGILIALAGTVLLALMIAMFFRTVVPTNEVHIVQRADATVSYGKGETAGNVYYAWPAWLPRIGLRVIKMPVSVFSVHLKAYEAYDKDRLPFVADVLAFFQVSDANTAAQRVASIDELKQQLTGILQGATRSIFATSHMNDILEKRAEFGQMFTEMTDHQLPSWGVVNVKNIELMDVRDATDSHVVHNIMAMKQSAIERDSRIQVADNKREGTNAEINAQRDVDLRRQEAEQLVGQRTAEKSQAVGIANEKAKQQIAVEGAVTAERMMEVKRVEEVRAADIQKQREIVHAEQARATTVINAEAEQKQIVIKAEATKQDAILRAEGQQQQTILLAEGHLQEQLKNAQGVEANGLAKGAALKAEQMATVDPQITLAKEIGSNEGYQVYLVNIEKVKAGQAVGIAQAGALEAAEIKIIANTGTITGGITKVMDIFTPQGGTQVGAMLEALAQTPEGEKIVRAAGTRLNGGPQPPTSTG